MVSDTSASLKTNLLNILGKYKDLLEKKWTSVIRLQRKVMELEAKISQMEEDGKMGNVISRRDVIGNKNKNEYLPRAPPKNSLPGHRSPITVSHYLP